VALSLRSYGRSTETAEAPIRNRLFTVRRKLSTATLVRARVTQAALHSASGLICPRVRFEEGWTTVPEGVTGTRSPFLARIGARDYGAVTITPPDVSNSGIADRNC